MRIFLFLRYNFTLSSFLMTDLTKLIYKEDTGREFCLLKMLRIYGKVISMFRKM